MMDDVVSPKKRRPKPKPFPQADTLRTPPVVSKPAAKPDAVDSSTAFKTPEAVAEADELEALQSLGKSKDYKPVGTSSTPRPTRAPQAPKGHWWLWRPSTWWQWALVALVAMLIVGGAAAGWYFTHKKPAPVAKAVVIKKTTKPAQPVYSNLSGLPITDASLNKKPVTAVMIENSTDARPQSGLSDAGVVYEAVAEGGITRFMALYQDTAPSSVGPVRSARPYYVQWALGFDAAYGHAGGSPDALSDITSWHVQDMNLLNYSSYAHRTSRPSPHNLYTDIAQLNQLEQKQGYSSTFTGFPRITGKEAPLAQPTASTIDLSPSSALYNPEYKYDAATNTYPRSIDGTAQTDANTGQQLAPKVVIAIVVPLGQGALDASGAYYSNYTVLGTGTAYVFQDGGVTEGQWRKANNTDMMTFTDSAGKPLPLDRGQTWITAVSTAKQVKYTGTAAAAASK